MSANLDVLFQPLRIGNLTLRNRLVMAPMTRNRSALDGVPTELNVLYYQQRASAGLIVSEGGYPSEMGKGYLFSPGLCNAAHAAGWKKVTDAVHGAGGAIFAQLMHVGRLSDPLMLGGAQPVAPSAVQPDPVARHYTVTCPRPKRAYPLPRALATEEVYAVIEDYRRSAALAREAGFDGVEIHAASGYLPMQFLSTNTNLRSDEFGGSLENRARFLLAIVDAIAADQGPAFVAVKLSPGWTFHNVFDDDAPATYSHVTRELSKRRIAYLQVGNYGMDWDVYGLLRPLFDGPFMPVASFTRQRAAEQIASGGADLVGFGQAFIANPDLVERFRNGWPINRPDIATYYTQGAEGYTDYPFHGHSRRDDLLPTDAPLVPVSADVTG